MTNEWKKIEQNPSWNFKNQDGTFSLKADDELQGIYLGMESNVGANNSDIYIFQKENGDKLSVWASSVLTTRFKNLVIGEEVKIVYKGKVDSEKTKGRSYHDYDVFHRETPMVKVDDIPVIQEDEDDVSKNDGEFTE